MEHRRIRGFVLAVAVGLLAAGLVGSQPAQAAAPTQIRDTFRDIFCEGQSAAGEEIVFAVFSSTIDGTAAAVQAATATGEHIGLGFGTSDWTSDSVQSSVEVLDDGSNSVGTAYLSATFAVRDDAQRVVSRFKDGNIRVVEDNTSATLEVRDAVMEFRGESLTVLRCDGGQVVGSLFFTNPSSYVARGNQLVVDGCVLDNVQDFAVEGDLDSMAFVLSYADRPDVSAFSPEVTFTNGRWSGVFDLEGDDGPLGEVAATATLTQTGDPVKLGGPYPPGGFERFRLTPYELVLTVDGPAAPARITCQLIDVQFALHTVTPHRTSTP